MRNRRTQPEPARVWAVGVEQSFWISFIAGVAMVFQVKMPISHQVESDQSRCNRTESSVEARTHDKTLMHGLVSEFQHAHHEKSLHQYERTTQPLIRQQHNRNCVQR